MLYVCGPRADVHNVAEGTKCQTCSGATIAVELTRGVDDAPTTSETFTASLTTLQEERWDTAN